MWRNSEVWKYGMETCHVAVWDLDVWKYGNGNMAELKYEGMEYEKAPFDVTKHLCVAKDLSEIDMKHVSRLLHHDVVVMAIAYSKNVRSHAVART